MDDWHPDTPQEAFARLEVAYDEQAARQMWDGNVDPALPVREGNPLEPGVYGDLGDVDLQTQVLALYSAGQSGSCPQWPVSVTTSDGVVQVEVTEDLQGGDGCTDDYNPYRALVVVDRDEVPPVDEIDDAQGNLAGGSGLSVELGVYRAD
ncbi:hypothetical protein [Cellulomonas bogoriensis]|uniref:hypothetical protein n=1 Tax=Cellulomonas bogoriensis TaxID=301388 RepID=UPI000AAF2FF4|nr:hypothetical protein [Cellulomonas bogoriensis]